MKTEKKTKKQKVLEWLMRYGEVTPMEAYENWNVMRLADTIFQFKKAGYQINTELQHKTNRSGDKISYAKYVLVSDKEGNAFQRSYIQSIDPICDNRAIKAMDNIEKLMKDASLSDKKRLVERPVHYKKSTEPSNTLKLGNQTLTVKPLFGDEN